MKVKGTRTGIIAGIALALFAALMLSTNMLAQPRFRGLDGPFMGGGARGMLPGLRALDLTDAQREEIRGVADQNRDAGRQLRERLGADRASLNEAVMAEVVSESTIRARAAEVATLEADVAVQHAHVNAQIWQVLTPDQRAELRELQAEAKERHGERGERRRQRR